MVLAVKLTAIDLGSISHRSSRNSRKAWDCYEGSCTKRDDAFARHGDPSLKLDLTVARSVLGAITLWFQYKFL
jgi:hypothetical protein